MVISSLSRTNVNDLCAQFNYQRESINKHSKDGFIVPKITITESSNCWSNECLVSSQPQTYVLYTGHDEFNNHSESESKESGLFCGVSLEVLNDKRKTKTSQIQRLLLLWWFYSTPSASAATTAKEKRTLKFQLPTPSTTISGNCFHSTDQSGERGFGQWTMDTQVRSWTTLFSFWA